MTKEQQKIVDRFHERVIQLIFKQRRAQKYSDWAEEEKIINEIKLIEDERRRYEGDIKSQRQEKREYGGALPEAETGTIGEAAEADVRYDQEGLDPVTTPDKARNPGCTDQSV